MFFWPCIIVYTFSNYQLNAQFLPYSMQVESGLQFALHLHTVRLFTEGDDTRGCSNTICPPEDEQRAARNMLRSIVQHTYFWRIKELCIKLVIWKSQHSYWILALVGGELSASRSGHFTLGKDRRLGEYQSLSGHTGEKRTYFRNVAVPLMCWKSCGNLWKDFMSVCVCPPCLASTARKITRTSLERKGVGEGHTQPHA